MLDENILKKKLIEIDLSLRSNYKNNSNIGVLSGISGVALFQFYYSKYIQQEVNADLGAEIVSEIIEKINEGYNFPTFCAGIAGGAWAIQHLKEEEFIDIDDDELLSGLDDYLIATMEKITNKNFYDFLHGILGIGFYFLKRYQNTKSDKLRTEYKNIILNIVQRLSSESQQIDNTVKWESYLITEEKLKGYNLGLSHGISSIVNFLSRLVNYDDFNKEVKNLLQKSVNYILSCQNKGISKTSCFPDWITLANEKSESSRLGWCYGDLGIGLSLWKAGKALQDIKICEKAIAVLKHTCKRRSLEETRIYDAGLCHGAFGVTHIYNYMYKQTDEKLFKEAADYWMQQSLDLAVHSDGYAGYMQWKGGKDEGWHNETNLLEGIAGIGLAIISYLTPFETRWDECLLIS